MLKKLLLASSVVLAAASAHPQGGPAAANKAAAPSAPIQPFAVRDYLRLPDYGRPVLSPNGKYLAVLVPINERLNLAVVDLQAHSSTVLTGFVNYDVGVPTWVGNDRLVYSVGQRNTATGAGENDGGGLFMISRDGKEARELNATVQKGGGRQMKLLSALPDDDRHILVEKNLRSADSNDVYKLDVTTGRGELLTTDRPARTGDWIVDRNFVPRVVTSDVKDELERIVWYRDSEGAPWAELTRIKMRGAGEADESFVPLAFDKDNQTLLVASNRGRDTTAIFKYDPRKKQFGEIVASHPRYDMGADVMGEDVPGLILSRRSREVLGYTVNADRLQQVWIEEAWVRLQAMVDKALPGRINALQRTDSDKTLINSYSDRSPPEYFLLDEASRKMEPVLSSMPWITDAHLVEMRPFLMKTRDGLEIPSYYFLPRNYKPGERLPTVVHIHGGPMARVDSWGPLRLGGFGVMDAQILASRGYAVVLPNFRITPGLGGKIYFKGLGSVGREMSEDHEDAAKWAIEQGFADPTRICISGASYGGYATLRALAKTPGLFRCGVAGLVVSDLDLQLKSTAGDTAYNTAGVKYWRRLIGEDKAPGTARAMSPVHQADKIKSPLFIWAGAADIRTPIEQTEGMITALRKAGQKPETLFKAGEGHGYGKLDNNVELYEKMLDFLDRQIGSKSLTTTQ